MKLRSFSALLSTALLAFSFISCDSDDNSGDDPFVIPSYTEGADCTFNTFKPFCEENALVKCDNGKVKKSDCGSDTCIWFPELATLDYAKDTQDFDIAECKDSYDMKDLAEDLCTTAGEKKLTCHPANEYMDEATVTNQVCLKANNEKMYYVFFDSDTYCGGTTCSEDKKSCGK